MIKLTTCMFLLPLVHSLVAVGVPIPAVTVNQRLT